LSLLPTPGDRLKHIGAVVAGIALIAGAVALMLARKRLTRPKPERESSGHRRSGSGLLLGGGLALAELPTAFPYFAAIAAIDAAGLSRAGEAVLIVAFNLIFLTPVLLLAALLAFFPSAWDRFVDPFRKWMRAHWPQLVAAVFAVGGVALLVYGFSS
jgi:cytochrome c biogenesis protein CcdA